MHMHDDVQHADADGDGDGDNDDDDPIIYTRYQF